MAGLVKVDANSYALQVCLIKVLMMRLGVEDEPVVVTKDELLAVQQIGMRTEAVGERASPDRCYVTQLTGEQAPWPPITDGKQEEYVDNGS